MKRTRHSAEQIVKKFHEAAGGLGGGKTVEEVCRSLAIGPAACRRRQSQEGEAGLDTVKECKALKEENTRLKRLAANQALDIPALKEVAEGKWWARRGSARRCASKL